MLRARDGPARSCLGKNGGSSTSFSCAQFWRVQGSHVGVPVLAAKERALAPDFSEQSALGAALHVFASVRKTLISRAV